MIEILTPTAYIFTGISLYAFITHIQVGLQQPFNQRHLLFALMCLSSSLYTPSNLQALSATSIEEFVQAYKLNIELFSIFLLGMIWFIADYTQYRPKPLLIGLSVCLFLILIVDITQPLGYQFEVISGLETRQLPWGETFTLAEGKSSLLFPFSMLILSTILLYMIYAARIAIQRNWNLNNVMMCAAVGFYVVLAIEATLVRNGYLNFMPLGMYASFGFIIVMSMVLRQEHSDKLKAAAIETERERTRLETILQTTSDGIHILSQEGVLMDANDAFFKMLGFDKQTTEPFHLGTPQA